LVHILPQPYKKAACEQLGIEQIFSSPWHPQSQGQVERQNDTLNNCLAVLASDHPDSWPELLPMVAYAFSSSKSATTELSAFELLFK
jgi:transposase InsO family protein